MGFDSSSVNHHNEVNALRCFGGPVINVVLQPELAISVARIEMIFFGLCC